MDFKEGEEFKVGKGYILPQRTQRIAQRAQRAAVGCAILDCFRQAFAMT
jgi:hypothetical protein